LFTFVAREVFTKVEVIRSEHQTFAAASEALDYHTDSCRNTGTLGVEFWLEVGLGHLEAGRPRKHFYILL